MEIRPILSTLRRHRIAATLVVAEIALTCAIVSNAVFLVVHRLELIHVTSGIAEHELVWIQSSGIGRSADPDARGAADLAALRQIPGVRAASATNQIPFGHSSWNWGVSLTPDATESSLNTTIYFGGEGLLETLGPKIVLGRGFESDEYLDYGDVLDPDGNTKLGTVIITRALAARLFPGKSGVGETVYVGDKRPIRVVGVLDHLVRPNRIGGIDAFEYAMVTPVRAPFNMGSNFVLRTTPGERAAVLERAEKVLMQLDPNRIVLDKKTFDEVRARYFQQDRSMVGLLIGVCVALLVVTALGIVGLASFWVAQRRRHIGIRRALGARRRDILRYFQLENFLLATLGIGLGMPLAYGLSALLMHHYETARLPAVYLPLGAVVLWLLGQLAVLAPARSAASVSPATATRNV